jgi:hypothetical protein
MKRVIIGLIVLAAIAAAAIRVLEIRPRFATMFSHTKLPLPVPKTKYDEARDLIRHAKVLLGDVVRESPGTADSYFARLQAAALEDIFKTDVPVTPVILADPIYWRVIRVETTESYTKATVEIENTNESNSTCFYIFDKHPLVLVANKKVYRMKKNAIEPPANVTQCAYSDDRWALQPTQAITLDLYFDALDGGTVDGMLKYADDQFREQPALFSLMNVHQSAAPE